MTVSQILQLPDKADVDFVRGRLETVYPPIKGTSKIGNPYHFQNCVLKDQTGEIKVKLSNCAEIPKSWENTQVFIHAGKGQAKDFLGLRRNTNTWVSNKTGETNVDELLEVDERCSVSQDAGMSNDTAEEYHRDREEERYEEPDPGPPPSQPNDKGRTRDSDSVREMKRQVGQKLNVFWMCWRSACLLREHAASEGKPLESGHFQGICETLYISFDRRPLPDDFPAKPLFKTTKTTK